MNNSKTLQLLFSQVLQTLGDRTIDLVGKTKTKKRYKIETPFKSPELETFIQLLMLDCQFENLNHIDFAEVKPRMRSYHMKIKQKQSDLEDYELKQTIGQGGFGKVKKGIHRLTGELVAVKICSVEGQDSQNLKVIEKQIQLQKNLRHQNIAQIYEVIKKDAKIYIFMEYCKNGQLFDKINHTGPMPEKEAARIFNQILSALLYLKQNGLSHRDIKPENVLFDENWNVKLIDFGFSCHATDFRRTICGTPSYTPPEILKRNHYDPEGADVWSLGVTLYAMLAAQLPFEGETNEKRKANIIACKYTPQPSFSLRAQRLFASIFVDAKHRPKLWELKASEFCLASDVAHPHFIDFHHENIELEDDIMNILDTDYHMDRQKVAESVINCRLDKYYAMYYLTLKNEKHTHKHIANDHLNEFKKKRKGSLQKLEPICRTPSLPKKMDDSLQEKVLSLKTSRLHKIRDLKVKTKRTLDTDSCKLRDGSPDTPSPLRIFDSISPLRRI